MPTKSHATRDRYLTGFPPSARMTNKSRHCPACSGQSSGICRPA
ncbi:hypothetical protein [Candidatus Spongiihabitans sp.]